MRQSYVVLAALCAGLALGADGPTEYLMLEGRSGVIEFIDTTTLKTVSHVTVQLPAQSSGLNGLFTDPDGETLYFEGPIGEASPGSNSCCWLYSLSLATQKTRIVAGIGGTESRRFFVNAGATILEPVSAALVQATDECQGDEWHSSPNHQWWFGLKRGPAIDIFDARHGKFVRTLEMARSDQDSWFTATWLADRFYLYSRNRLWEISPTSREFGNGVSLEAPTQGKECSEPLLTDMGPMGDRLLLYAVFGGKLDPRWRCPAISGGAWAVDPSTGQATRLLPPSFHFWKLLSNRSGSELFGVTSEEPGTVARCRLLRVDAHTGDVLQSRNLDADAWWIAIAPLRSVPPDHTIVTLAYGDEFRFTVH